MNALETKGKCLHACGWISSRLDVSQQGSRSGNDAMAEVAPETQRVLRHPEGPEKMPRVWRPQVGGRDGDEGVPEYTAVG